MEQVTFYLLQVFGGNFPQKLLSLKGEVFVTPSSHLGGITKAAYIREDSLAERFRESLLQKFEKRYGTDMSISVMKMEEKGTAAQVARTNTKISKDTATLRASIEVAMIRTCSKT